MSTRADRTLSMKKRQKQGKLLIVEGPDGVGKTTIASELARRLNEAGQPCEIIAFPGNEPGTLGKLIYGIHHQPMLHGVERLTPTAAQALHLAAHLDSIEQNILPMLRAGRHVVLDRFWWSMWVYGLVCGVRRHILRRMAEVERAQWRGVNPFAAFLIRRNEPINRDEPKERWLTLSHEYDVLAEKERKTHPVFFVDNNGTFPETVESIMAALPHLVSDLLPNEVVRTSKQEHQLGLLDPSQRPLAPFVVSHILPAKPTVVFDTYWRFAAERQRIFFGRLEGGARPWTLDPILNTFKFTNAYRASDRASQYLIRHVIYRDDLPSTEIDVFFRVMLFKLFNKIETWQLLERELGPLTHSGYSFERFDNVLTKAMGAGKTIYSAAYIMPSGGKLLGHAVKHRNHLSLLGMMIANELPKKLADARSMQEGFQLLRDYPTIGDFLAYQFITDLNYSELTNFSESEFVMPGPGALDGIRKCFVDRGGLNEPEIIKFMADIQESEFARLGLEFRSLWGRPLQLIDCQNLFCEVDKYSRVKHPEISGISGRLRIKQKYSENLRPMVYWYPPKWQINDLIEASVQISAAGSGANRT
jgi:thymidylate kinase